MKKARLCLDFEFDQRKGLEIIDSLRALGYWVTTTPVSGTQPCLSIGNREWEGVYQIEKFISEKREKNRKR